MNSMKVTVCVAPTAGCDNLWYTVCVLVAVRMNSVPLLCVFFGLVSILVVLFVLIICKTRTSAALHIIICFIFKHTLYNFKLCCIIRCRSAWSGFACCRSESPRRQRCSHLFSLPRQEFVVSFFTFQPNLWFKKATRD